MAELVLQIAWHLGGGAVVIRYEEDGVVTKAVLTARLVDDHPFPARLADDRGGIVGVAHIDQHTPEAGALEVVRRPLELLQQLVDVLLVAGVVAGETGGVDTGAAVQQIHFEAGVIGHGGQSGDAGGVAGLDDGVFDEGGAGLIGIGHCKLALRDHLDLHIGQHGGQFLHLFLIPCCQDKLVHRTPPQK